jgi:hypothetical protein
MGFRIQRHPNGFVKITLFSLFGFKVRIHYWRHGTDGSRSDIHTHRWTYVSIPLKGSFIEKRYAETDDVNFVHRRCYPEPVNGRRLLETVGRGSVQPYTEARRRPFIPYVCRAGAIHSYIPIGTKSAMTLVITGPAQSAYADVWHTMEYDVPLNQFRTMTQ